MHSVSGAFFRFGLWEVGFWVVVWLEYRLVVGEE